jgi:dienelactone hydrolase
MEIEMLQILILTCLLLAVATSCASAAPADGLNVLPEKVDGVPPAAMMDAYLKRLAYQALERREAAYEKITSPEQARDYQIRVRQFFMEQLGAFPARTPLNARVVAGEMRDGYRIEKVIYESQPGLHVTAVLYLPLAPPPHPAVLVPCGHSENGKALEDYQRACILLAKNGLAALCFDPVGQGERKQILDEAGRGRFRPTAEHDREAASCILLGRNLASIMIWDGIRSIDYLLSRGDIDAARIGCAGNSGGGTQTSYLMALDDRIACASPNCYLTSFRRLLETIGPQDAEQNIYRQVAFGMDHADYVILRAPKPTLICAATRDFFDIGGTWHTYREAKRFYGRLELPERVDLAEADATHGFSRQIRIATARWMRRWLMGKDDAVTEEDFPVMTDEQLQCTPRGQVLFLEGARSIFELNREIEARLAGDRQRMWTAGSEKALAEVRRLAGIRPLAELAPPQVEKTGSLERNGYRIEKLVLTVEPGIRLPALDFAPPSAGDEVALYLHGEGKQVDAAPGGPIEKLVLAGRRVLAVDLNGLGELQSRNARGEPAGTSPRDVALAYLLGKSYVGMRAEHLLQCAILLAGGPGKEHRRVRLVAVGEAGPPALHAAALEPALFASVRLERCLRSWAEVARAVPLTDQRASVVHGALKTYDLPDLARALGKKLVVME